MKNEEEENEPQRRRDAKRRREEKGEERRNEEVNWLIGEEGGWPVTRKRPEGLFLSN